MYIGLLARNPRLFQRTVYVLFGQPFEISRCGRSQMPVNDKPDVTVRGFRHEAFSIEDDAIVSAQLSGLGNCQNIIQIVPAFYVRIQCILRIASNRRHSHIHAAGIIFGLARRQRTDNDHITCLKARIRVQINRADATRNLVANVNVLFRACASRLNSSSDLLDKFFPAL